MPNITNRMNESFKLNEAFSSSIISSLYTNAANKQLLNQVFRTLLKRRYSINGMTDQSVLSRTPEGAYKYKGEEGDKYLKLWCKNGKIVLVTWANTMIDTNFNWDAKATDNTKRDNKDIIGDATSIAAYMKSSKYLQSLDACYMVVFDGMKKLPVKGTIKQLSGFKEIKDFDAKDETRINDIVTKAGGDKDKELALSSRMANSITDKLKAVRRFNASVKVLGLKIDVMAPTKENPSMTMAIEKYIRANNK
jgi:hypothetical protein